MGLLQDAGEFGGNTGRKPVDERPEGVKGIAEKWKQDGLHESWD